ncbi:hypothetical protein [Vallitalea okinawensis]|uniref:hypothetical protein n=1 Tax=Vallitalea okinawensis TaxID=2078660 RepID=UPI000CFAE54B|nr:hypothetical protein [Vallitalea okinawensis]
MYSRTHVKNLDIDIQVKDKLINAHIITVGQIKRCLASGNMMKVTGFNLQQVKNVKSMDE